MARLPNPLQINFGHGDILVSSFRDNEGAGIVIWAATKRHNIGDEGPQPNNPHNPKKGEIYLYFTNKESLQVVREALDEAESFLKS